VLSSIFAKGIHDQRRSLPAWILGMALYVAMLCAVYPAVHKSAGSLNQYLQNLPAAFRNAFLGGQTDFSSPSGFIDTEMFSFMGPILILVFSVGLGARLVAGEEEAGTLDLVLAYPVSRRSVILQKFAVLTVGVTLLTAALCVSLLVGTQAAGMSIAAGRLVQASVLLGLLGMVFGSLAFVAAAASGRRVVGLSAGGGLAWMLYLLNALGQLVHSLSGVRLLSLFHYYGGAAPLRRGLDTANLGAFLLITALALGAALVAFQRRDLQT
jgi:ABC-2 type transport system permease protein